MCVCAGLGVTNLEFLVVTGDSINNDSIDHRLLICVCEGEREGAREGEREREKKRRELKKKIEMKERKHKCKKN